MVLTPQKISLTLLLIFSLGLVCVSGAMVMASLWARQVNAFLASWEEGGVEPDPKAWQIAFDAANNAISLYPGSNADYYDRLGRVWEWKQFQHSFDDVTAFDSRSNALDAYRQSVATRPLWPYTWTSLAYTKMRLQQIDDEFIDALRKSSELGPWRIKSNKRVAEMGLITWFDLDDKTRALVLESLRRTVDFGVKEAQWLEQRAIDTNRRLIFCSVIAKDIKEKRHICAAEESRL